MAPERTPSRKASLAAAHAVFASSFGLNFDACEAASLAKTVSSGKSAFLELANDQKV